MNNINKCIRIIDRLNADAVLLSDEANMHYICGFSPSEGRILITHNNAYHLVDSRYTEIAMEHSKENGLSVIEISKSFTEHIAELVQNNGIKALVFENETISYKSHKALCEQLTDTKLIELGDCLMRERNRKEPEEIIYMKQANAIAEKAFSELLNHIKVGKSEKELASYFDYLMAQYGSDGVSFDTILLTGAHTSMPHGVPGERKIQNGDFVLFDFGATHNGYHSDMTRTICVGTPTEEMQEAYDLVLRAQLAGIKALGDGMKCCDVYKAAYDVLAEKNMADYFRHSLGHGVGLEIHEGFNASPKSTDTYEIGNVASIEPGIYIPDEFGIRIEDVCYISPRGRENLSTITKKLITL